MHVLCWQEIVRLFSVCATWPTVYVHIQRLLLLSQGRKSAPQDLEKDSSARDEYEEEEEEEGAAVALREVKEQFEAYRKEKAENDSILNKQLEEMREQTSHLRLENAKLASKVGPYVPRYLGVGILPTTVTVLVYIHVHVYVWCSFACVCLVTYCTLYMCYTHIHVCVQCSQTSF